MNKKILVIRGNTAEELANRINSLKEDTSASQIFQEEKVDIHEISPDLKIPLHSERYVAFVYYEPKLDNEKKNDDYKKEPATQWMKNKLKDLGISIPLNLTKGRYYELLKENKVRK